MLEYRVPDSLTTLKIVNYACLPINQIGNHAKPSVQLVHLNFHLKYDLVLTVQLQTIRVQVSDQLVQNTEVYGPIKFEEIVIFMIVYKFVSVLYLGQ